MQKAICLQAIVPIRREPSEPGEMVTQLLFGETVSVIENNIQWMRVTCDYDNYSGWCDSKCLSIISEDDYRQLSETNYAVTSMLFAPIIEITKPSIYWLPAGATFYFTKKEEFSIAGSTFKAPDQMTLSTNERIENLAQSFINVPYIWGGRSSFGADCSGFIQTVFKIYKTRLPRDAYQQAGCGESVDSFSEAKSGDLLFFENSVKKIVHVGMLLPNNQIVHASGKIRIDTVDQQGIYNTELSKYTHQLSLIRRITLY